mmetsp:Transcript_54274/g.131689  ORF Transcript_54274/g.131689 Transcript_54274/m.131689 type:complete len:275 (-) Transcript_54274:192-1016(-)
MKSFFLITVPYVVVAATLLQAVLLRNSVVGAFVVPPPRHQPSICSSSSSSTSSIIVGKQQSGTRSSRNSAVFVVTPDSIQQAWTSYNEALEAQPLLVKSLTAGVLLGAADLAGQAVQQVTASAAAGDDEEAKSASIDFARTARFAFFGLVLQAPWNHAYYSFLDGAIPPTEDPWTTTTAVKTVIDQFVQAPIFTVLIFAFLGFLEGKNAEQIKSQLEDDYADTMVANWKLWVPATVINLAFVPPILRVLYLNVVFFFWSIFLSLKLNKDEGSSA